MAKQRKGESVSVYLDTELNERVVEKAENETKSKSEVINEILRKELIKDN